VEEEMNLENFYFIFYLEGKKNTASHSPWPSIFTNHPHFGQIASGGGHEDGSSSAL
jgi:hypothetical protein